MKVSDLLAMAKDAEYVVLRLRRASCPSGEYVRLAGRSGPKGKIFSVVEAGPRVYDVVACFQSPDIIKFISEGNRQCLKQMPPTL